MMIIYYQWPHAIIILCTNVQYLYETNVVLWLLRVGKWYYCSTIIEKFSRFIFDKSNEKIGLLFSNRALMVVKQSQIYYYNKVAENVYRFVIMWHVLASADDAAMMNL